MLPSSAIGTSEGRARTRKARPVRKPASSFPSTISVGLSRLACSVARVPAVRSPLMDPADSAGTTSSIAKSTRIICRLNTIAAIGPTSSHCAEYSVGPRPSAPMPIITSVHTASATYQRLERRRWRSSSEVTSRSPRQRSA